MKKKNEYTFTSTTFSLLLCVFGLIAFLLFILGYQVGRVRGVPSYRTQSTSKMTAQNIEPTKELTPVPFEKESLSFYKTVHRETPLVTYDKPKKTKTAKPDPTRIPTKLPTSEPEPVETERYAATSSTGDKFTIQVASFSEEIKANTLSDTLQKHGFPSYVTSFRRPGQAILYRVRVGHYSSRESALEVSRQIKNKENLDTWVTAD